MDSILLRICSTRRYRCCKYEKEAQDAQQFLTLYLRRTVAFFYCESYDIGRVMLTSLTDFNNFPKLAKYQQNNVEL